MNISTQDARGLYTKMLVDVFKDSPQVMSFLRSFFKPKESGTLSLSIEVQRGYEKVAVDVFRGSEGNSNDFSKSTEKIIKPPFYREFFNATALDLYDKLYGASEIGDAVFQAYLEQVFEKLMACKNKIDRAIELQCSQVLETGIIQLVAGTSIDYGRNALSLVDKGAGQYWASSGVNPFVDLENGCNYIRQVGKAQSDIFDAVCGSSALASLLTNDVFVERNDLKNISLDSVHAPQKNAVGGTLHGIVTVGPYRVRLWTYGETYDDSTNTAVPYVNPKKLTLLPENPRFVLGYAAVPQLITEENPVPVKGAYVFGDYIDKRKAAHIHDVKSAAVAIPVGVDQMYTLKVVAG